MVQTTLDPGTVSVPMSSILDALEGVLSDAERTALFEQLIGLRPAGVAPGDLITAELFNQVLSDINDLAKRVAMLEGATDTTPRLPIVTQIVPQIVKTGQEFTVFGENLNPNLLSRIDVDDTNIPLDRIKSGSPTRLVLDAPAIIGLAQGGETVIFSVSNPAGTGQGTYTQLPGVAANIQATLSFVLKSVSPVEDIKPNKAYDYTFEVQIQSSHDEKFVLTPQVSGQGWTAVNKTPGTIDVTSASAVNTVTLTRVVTVTTGATGSANLLLTVHGTNFPAFTTSSLPTPIAIAAAQDIPTDKIKLKNATAIGSNAKFVNNTLFIKRKPDGGPATATLSMVYQFDITGAFKVTDPVANPAADWLPIRTSQTPINIGTAGVTSTIIVKFTPKSAGIEYTAANGQVDFLIQSNNGPDKLPFSAQLRIVDVLP